MPRFTSPFDGAQLFYRDYVPAKYPPPFSPNEAYGNKPQPTLVFLHGWPMSSVMFEQLMLPLCESYRFRCIATDRRGFGKSDWDGPEPVSSPIDYTVFAGDTVYLLEKLNIGPFVFVGASMGSGESLEAYFQSQYIKENCKGFFWIGAALPNVIASPENPTAPTRKSWDAIIQGLRDARPEYAHAAIPSVLGADAGQEISEHTNRRFEQLVQDADALATERCAQIITTTDFTEKLRRLNEETDVPITCTHGDKDSGCPASASVDIIRKIVPRAVVKMYENGSHGIYLTHSKQTIEDILEFVQNVNM